MAEANVESQALQSRIVLQYFEAPVLVKRSLFRGRRFAPLVLGGLYYAATVTARARTQHGSSTFTEDVRSEVKRGDSGWIAGGGAEFRTAGRTWEADVRYLSGFSNIGALTTTSVWRTRSLTATLSMIWR